jgi:hypothetical protein
LQRIFDEKDLGYRVRRLWIAEGDLLEAAEQLRDAMEAINRTRKRRAKMGAVKKFLTFETSRRSGVLFKK